MAEYIDFGDGLVINSETGEIVEFPAGGDPAFMLAQKFFQAKEQEKAWKQDASNLQRAILAKQEERKATYGDVVISIRQSSRTDLDIDALREELSEAEFTLDDWRTLALAAKDFDLDRLDGMRGIVAKHQQKRQTAAYAVAERVRKYHEAVA